MIRKSAGQLLEEDTTSTSHVAFISHVSDEGHHWQSHSLETHEKHLG